MTTRGDSSTAEHYAAHECDQLARNRRERQRFNSAPRSWLADHESKDDERTETREHARRWAMMRSETPPRLRMRQETRARIAERARELMPLGGYKERTI